MFVPAVQISFSRQCNYKNGNIQIIGLLHVTLVNEKKSQEVLVFSLCLIKMPKHTPALVCWCVCVCVYVWIGLISLMR